MWFHDERETVCNNWGATLRDIEEIPNQDVASEPCHLPGLRSEIML
jgi:hypothetical protein